MDNVFCNEAIAFVESAGRYCGLMEKAGSFTRSEWVREARIGLASLYHSFSMLPGFEPVLDEPLEKFVGEGDWISVRDAIRGLLKKFDDYLEVFDPSMQESEGPVVRSISEDLTDIYQDAKDFASLYHMGTPDIMNDALWECQTHFREYWGQKAVNVLRALHQLEFEAAGLDADDDEDQSPGPREKDTGGWLISKRMEDFRKDPGHS